MGDGQMVKSIYRSNFLPISKHLILFISYAISDIYMFGRRGEVVPGTCMSTRKREKELLTGLSAWTGPISDSKFHQTGSNLSNFIGSPGFSW